MMQALPLAGYGLLDSRDLDEARERVAAVFCPHRLEAHGTGLAARHNHLRGQALSLNLIEYGARMAIEPGRLGSFYLVQIALAGGAEIRHGGRHMAADIRTASVLNPHLPLAMDWAAGTRKLILQVARAPMQARLEAMLGRPAARVLAFDGRLDVAAGPGAALKAGLLRLIGVIDAGGLAFGADTPATARIEAAIMDALLTGLRHSHTDLLDQEATPPHPARLRLAEAYIEANLDQPLTIEAIAAAAHCSARSLQMAFQQARGVSPLAWWRDRRLDRVRAALAAGEASVTGAALAWGFTHLGRFSAAYRARFGETPSQTLRRYRTPGR